MDGAVALWDTSRVGRESGRPLELFRDFSAHNGGIFSMHWSRGGGILTSSKDGATCVSRLADDLGTVSLNDKKVTHQTETETKRSNGVFVVERRIDDAHVGVVKCARWRMCPTLSSCGDGGDDALFATCGNDGRVCVLDKRAKRATVATLDDAHGGVAVNFLEWAAAASGPGVGSCVAENVFCTSASNDHRVLVWDLRFLTARVPLASLAGHIPRSVTKPRALYRPAFIAGGAAGVAVVTTGERSNAASLYHLNLPRGASFAVDAWKEGKRNAGQPNGVTSRKSPFSRGDVGFDATATTMLAARDGGGVGAGGWTLAMADRGEVRVYRSKWGDAEDVSGDA
jgi:WD40 repeat protein